MYPDEPNTISVTTCLPRDLWKQAQLNNIRWNEALITGIQVHSGINNDEKDLIEKINKMENELIVLKDKLKDIRKENEKKEAEDKVRIVRVIP